jgi:hypothetical protein
MMHVFVKAAMRFYLMALIACSVAGLGRAQAGLGDPTGPDWEGLVGLDQGVWGPAGQATGQTLWVRVEKRAGVWGPLVWGYSRGYTNGDYVGTITGAALPGGQVELTVRLIVDEHAVGKPRGRSGLGEYRIRFQPDGTALQGTWEGTFCSVAGTGAVRGTIEPLRPRAADFAMPQPGEHPSLLCRKADLPALRKKLQSPWGQQMIAKLTATDAKSMSRMAVGQGLLYALTGDKAYAEKAQRLLEADINGGRLIRTEVHDPSGVKVHDGGIGAGEVAIAYDLIYDACPPEFRARMGALFARKAPYLWRCPANGSDTSNWSAMYRSGVGMCGLALLGDRQDYWPEPVEPHIVRVAADAALTGPPAGLPVVPLQSGQPIAEWLQAGPLPLELEPDPLAVLGGAAAPIAAGKTVKVSAVMRDRKTGALDMRVIEKAFAPLTAGMKRGGPGKVNLNGTPLGQFYFLATVIDNEQAGYYTLELPNKPTWFLNPTVYINEQPVRSGDCCHLEKGRHTIMAPVQVGAARLAEVLLWSLTLRAVDEPAAQAWLAQQQADNRLGAARRQIMQDAARAAGVNPWGLYWAGVGRQWIENWATWAGGSFGWAMAGEAYTQHAYQAVFPFAHSYRNALGEDLVGRPNLRMALPRYAGQTIFRPDGASLQGYGPGGSALGVDGYARGFGLVPRALQPAVLWGWNRTLALAEAGKLKGAYLTEDFLDPMSAAFMFVNYPAPDSGITEQSPARALPHVMLDDWKGGYVFRNRWRDGGDCVATIYGNWNFAGGEWNGAETGDFRISGLGVDWLVRGTGWGVKPRTTEPEAPTRRNQNLLEIGEADANSAGPATPTYQRASLDGSAVLTLDMQYVYADTKAGKGGKALPPLPPLPRPGTPDVLYDLGVRGIRAFAADYSGASGAPALFAVVDRVTGTAAPTCWHLVTDAALPVTVAGNTFTIHAPNGATLMGTVLAPAGAGITTRAATLGTEAAYDGDHQPAEFRRTVIDIPAKDFVFVVMTIQQDDGSAAVVQGAGAQAQVSIGKQTVRFDGEKLVLGQFAGDLQVAGPLAAALRPQPAAEGEHR